MTAGGRPPTWRKAGRVVLAIGLALLLAIALGFLMLRFAGNAYAAMLALRTLRPWLIGLQITALALLWHYWAAVVGWLGRRRQMSPVAQAALVHGRRRIFMLLGACELLIVLRAFFG